MDNNREKAQIIYNAYKIADILYLDYTIHRNVFLLSQKIYSFFEKNFEHKEQKEYIEHLYEFFSKLGIPYESISLRRPDFFMQDSLTCFSGNFAFKKSCDMCLEFENCKKLLLLQSIIKRIIQKIQTIGVIKK